MAMQQDDRKLAELILYVSQKSANDPNFGQTKLKILYFADFSNHGTSGETITGSAYQHLKQGPVVLRMLPVQEALVAEGAMAIQKVNFYGFSQDRPIPLRNLNLSLFTGQDIATVDAWVDLLWKKTAREVSLGSHDTAGWRLTKEREVIDPKTVFIAWGEPTEAEVRRGRALAERHGLLA